MTHFGMKFECVLFVWELEAREPIATIDAVELLVFWVGVHTGDTTVRGREGMFVARSETTGQGLRRLSRDSDILPGSHHDTSHSNIVKCGRYGSPTSGDQIIWLPDHCSVDFRPFHWS